MEYSTGQHLLTIPEIKRYILRNNFSNEVTEYMLKNAFKAEYTKIMSNRNEAWTVTDYYD